MDKVIMNTATSTIEEDERRKKRRITIRKQLPDGVESEILLGLPVKSMMRFKCVCKPWYDLIRSLHFITSYNMNDIDTRKVSLFCESARASFDYETTKLSFRASDVSLELTIPTIAGTFNMVGCSHGLVCFTVTSRHEKFVVWNPAIRMFRLITTTGSLEPGRFSDEFNSGFFFDLITNTFKLARIHFIPSTERNLFLGVQVDIFTSSANTWTRKKLDFPSQFYKWGNVSWGTSVKRSMYWIIRDAIEHYILCFDIVDEQFKRIEMPYRDYQKYSVTLKRYAESPALFVWFKDRTHHHHCDVWLMNDCDGTNQNHWSKKPAFTPSIGRGYPVGSFRKDEVDWFILKYHRKLFLCNPKTGESTMEFSGQGHQDYFLYRESLASEVLQI